MWSRRARVSLCLHAYLVLCASAFRRDMETLETWCNSAPTTYTTATGNARDNKCAYAMGSCYCLAVKDSANTGRWWHFASHTCATRPSLPAGVIGHLALAPAQWVVERLAQLLVYGDSTCAWVALHYYESPPTGAAAGWYHEPYGSHQPELRTWSVRADSVPTWWADGEPGGGDVCACASPAGLKARGCSERRWTCQYHYDYSVRRPNTFYKVAGGADRWPVPAAQISETSVRKRHAITDCTRVCAADWQCAGFAVNERTALCVTAYEVTYTGAVEAYAGYVLYERVYVA